MEKSFIVWFGCFLVLMLIILPRAVSGNDEVASPGYFKIHSAKSGQKVAIYFDPLQQVGLSIEYRRDETDCSKLLFVINSLYPYNTSVKNSDISIKINMSIDEGKSYTDVLNGILYEYPDAGIPVDIYSFVIIMTDEFILNIIDGKKLNYSDNTYQKDKKTIVDINNLIVIVEEIISSCTDRNKGYKSKKQQYKS